MVNRTHAILLAEADLLAAHWRRILTETVGASGSADVETADLLVQKLIAGLRMTEADGVERSEDETARHAASAFAEINLGAPVDQVARAVLELRSEVWNILARHMRTSDVESIRLAQFINRSVDQILVWVIESYHSAQIQVVERRALTDRLTGLANREYFDHRFAEEIERARRYGYDLTLLVLDMDNLKWINDHHGHPTGDRALRHVSEILTSSTRAVDLVARLGGDEFAIVMPDTSLAAARHGITRIQGAIGARPFLLPDGASPTLGLSIGAAAYPADGDTAERLMSHADREMYEAKAQSRQTPGLAGQDEMSTGAEQEPDRSSISAELAEVHQGLRALLAKLEELERSGLVDDSSSTSPRRTPTGLS